MCPKRAAQTPRHEVAAATLAFLLSDPSTLTGQTLPKGTKANAQKGDPPPSFETDADIDIVPAEARVVLSTKNPDLRHLRRHDDGSEDPVSSVPDKPKPNETEWLYVSWDGENPKLKDMPLEPPALPPRLSTQQHAYLWVGFDANLAPNGGGKAGEVGTGAITALESQMTGVAAVTNPVPARGGRDPETLEQAKRRARKQLSTRAVCEQLDQHRLVTTEVQVVPPRYCRLCNFVITVKARAGYIRALLQDIVEARLATYLHILKGGDDGKGFPFGAQVHAANLMAQIFRCEGVERVDSVRADFTHSKSNAAARQGVLLLCPAVADAVDNSQDGLAAGCYRDPRPCPGEFEFDQPGRQRRRFPLLRLRRILLLDQQRGKHHGL